jgi:hypothetical protein
MAQSRDGSGHYFGGMPNAATAVGAVDMFLPVAAMPDRLLAPPAHGLVSDDHDLALGRGPFTASRPRV